MDADSSWNFFGSLSYRDFTLQGGFARREKVNPTAQYFTTFNDPRLSTLDDRGYVDLKFAHEFPGVAEVTARVYYDRNNFQIGYPFGDPVAVAFFEEAQAGEWWGAELNLSKRLWEKHVITFGAEYRDDFHQAKRVFDESTTYTEVHTSRQSHGVYLEADFAVRTNLHLTGGVRYDRYGDLDPSFNPRLALIYHPFKQSTLKALYGTAFRAPNALELSDPRFQNVEPERITSYEVVYEQGLGGHLRSSVSGFYNQMHDLIIFESGNFDNVDAEARGVELALDGTWPSGVRGRASYTFQQTENRSGGRGFPDSPEHLVKFNLSVPLHMDKIFAGVEYQYTGSRHTVFNTPIGTTVAGQDTAGFGVLNVTVFSRNLLKHLEFSASVYNLLDTAYADPSSRFHSQDQLPRDGRTFRLKLTYGF
jgi:iron complex outermembrane receptor protein